MKNTPALVHFFGAVLLFLCIYFAPWYVQLKDYKGHVEKASFRSSPIWSTPELESRETAGLAYGLLLVRLGVAAAVWWGLLRFFDKITNGAVRVAQSRVFKIILLASVSACILLPLGFWLQRFEMRHNLIPDDWNDGYKAGYDEGLEEGKKITEFEKWEENNTKKSSAPPPLKGIEANGGKPSGAVERFEALMNETENKPSAVQQSQVSNLLQTAEYYRKEAEYYRQKKLEAAAALSKLNLTAPAAGPFDDLPNSGEYRPKNELKAPIK